MFLMLLLYSTGFLKLWPYVLNDSSNVNNRNLV